MRIARGVLARLKRGTGTVTKMTKAVEELRATLNKCAADCPHECYCEDAAVSAIHKAAAVCEEIALEDFNDGELAAGINIGANTCHARILSVLLKSDEDD